MSRIWARIYRTWLNYKCKQKCWNSNNSIKRELTPTCAAGAAVSDLAASGGRAWEERERGGGLGEARPCGGPAGAAAAAAAGGAALGAAACCGRSGAGSVGCIGGGSWDWAEGAACWGCMGGCMGDGTCGLTAAGGPEGGGPEGGNTEC